MLDLCRVGMGYPSVEVRFENLSAEASVHTNTSRNLPSVLNAYLNIAEVSSLPAVSEAKCISGFLLKPRQPRSHRFMLEKPVHLTHGLRGHGLH